MSTVLRKCKSNEICLKESVHHCQLILSYWCRLLDLDSLTISYTNSIICHTVTSYRGPGDIVAFSSNARLSSIEIYNSITNYNLNKDSTAQQISSKLCIKPVHTNMNFNHNNIIKTWHPTLCTTLDYQYLYRIGGADPLKGLFGESSANVDVFNIYNMSHIQLPSMKQKRSKCSATILPPTIPFHDYIDNDTEDERSAPNLHNLLNEIKGPKFPLHNIAPPDANIARDISPTPPLCAPSAIAPIAPMAPIAPIIAKGNIEQHSATKTVSIAPIALKESSSSPTSSPLAEPPNAAAAPLPMAYKTRNTADIIAPALILPAKSAPLLPLNMNRSSSAVYGGRSRKNSTRKERFVNGEYPEYCVFVSGGLNGSKLHKKCEIFYPFEGSWNPVMSMKQARCGHISQYMGSTQWKYLFSSGKLTKSITEWKDVSDLTTKVFVCGGRREHGNGITSCESFDVESNKWKLCKRAPFTNHGYQSGCWWSNKQCVAMISDPMDGNKVAIYKPSVNKWNVIGESSQKEKNGMKNSRKNDMHLTHFYPLIGTLWLFGEEYLYIMGDDYKCKNLEIYDERNDEWIPIGISYKTNKDDPSLTQKYDQLLQLTKHQQFDAFSSIS